MKKIRFLPSVPAEIRAIPQPIALDILKALHRYIETGIGRVKPLSGEFMKDYCARESATTASFFGETADTVTLHRVC